MTEVSPPPPVVDGPSDVASGPSARERPQSGGEPPAKRPRVWAGEDKKRGQRLMGNLLGTLTKFKGEEQARAKSDKAKQRDEVANKVAAKMKEENERMHEVSGLEKERRHSRNEMERLEAHLRAKEISVRTRSRQLPRLSHFLVTTSSWVSNTEAEKFPLSIAPAKDKNLVDAPKPLFYRPKKLLPEQEDLIEDQISRTEKAIRAEEDDLAELRTTTADTISDLSARLQDASTKLAALKREAAGATGGRGGDVQDVPMKSVDHVKSEEPLTPLTKDETPAKSEAAEEDVKMDEEEVEY